MARAKQIILSPYPQKITRYNSGRLLNPVILQVRPIACANAHRKVSPF